MTKELAQYLERLFAEIPASSRVDEAKEELLAGMVERYHDYRAQGMDEQAAYDAVIEHIGDIHELFDALRAGDESRQATSSGGADTEVRQNRSYGNTPPDSFGLDDFIEGMTGFAQSVLSGVLGSVYGEDVRLVNTRVISLEGLREIMVELFAESVDIFAAEDGDLTVKEYMNRDDPSLLADIWGGGGLLNIKGKRRIGVFGLRSRMEIYLPADWQGKLSVSTASGSVKSGSVWRLGGLTAKSASGSVEFRAVEAPYISLHAVSGSVRAERLQGQMELHSVSGSVKVDNAAGFGEIKSVSGGVRVSFTRLDGDLHASSVSGSVRLELPHDASVELSADTVSGSIRTGFDQYLRFERRNRARGLVGTGPYHRVTARSTSGSIRVNA